jgi:hypothetical protein
MTGKVFSSRAIALFLAISLSGMPAFAETPSGAATASGAVPDVAAPTPASDIAPLPATGAAPLPATGAKVLPPGFRARPRENPWRRFEIIAFGAFPILLFYVDIGFDAVKYASNGFDSRYLPWPFKGDNAMQPEEGEYLARLGVAAGASLIFSGVDAWIRAARYRKAAGAEPVPELDSSSMPD